MNKSARLIVRIQIISLVTQHFLKLESVFMKKVFRQKNRKTVVERLNKTF